MAKFRLDMIVEAPDDWNVYQVELAIETACEEMEDTSTEAVRIIEFIDTYEI